MLRLATPNVADGFEAVFGVPRRLCPHTGAMTVAKSRPHEIEFYNSATIRAPGGSGRGLTGRRSRSRCAGLFSITRHSDRPWSILVMGVDLSIAGIGSSLAERQWFTNPQHRASTVYEPVPSPTTTRRTDRRRIGRQGSGSRRHSVRDCHPLSCRSCERTAPLFHGAHPRQPAWPRRGSKGRLACALASRHLYRAVAT